MEEEKQKKSAREWRRVPESCGKRRADPPERIYDRIDRVSVSGAAGRRGPGQTDNPEIQ